MIYYHHYIKSPSNWWMVASYVHSKIHEGSFIFVAYDRQKKNERISIDFHSTESRLSIRVENESTNYICDLSMIQLIPVYMGLIRVGHKNRWIAITEKNQTRIILYDVSEKLYSTICIKAPMPYSIYYI